MHIYFMSINHPLLVANIRCLVEFLFFYKGHDRSALKRLAFQAKPQEIMMFIFVTCLISGRQISMQGREGHSMLLHKLPLQILTYCPQAVSSASFHP